jgi:3'(2'), 5'-bisphosphate nucleotidase
MCLGIMASMSLDLQRPYELLPDVIAVARAAGREIMAVYAHEFAVTLKDDRSPLTAADLAAHRAISAGLARIGPMLPQLSEESPPEEIAARREWRSLWLIDPLDGTREFVNRNGEFTVNIALVHDQQPVLGVLYAPVAGLLYAAARGAGAWLVDEQGRHSALQASARSAQPPRVLASRSHRGTSLDALLARLGAHTLVSAGSALKFGHLSAGRADFYPRLSPTSEWDTAAGQAIVEAAGGCVVGLDGAALRYNARDTLQNPSFLCWADNSRDWLSLADANPG